MRSDFSLNSPAVVSWQPLDHKFATRYKTNITGTVIHEEFCRGNLCSHLNVFDNFSPSLGDGCSGSLNAFRFFVKDALLLHTVRPRSIFSVSHIPLEVNERRREKREKSR